VKRLSKTVVDILSSFFNNYDKTCECLCGILLFAAD
jgi:hypothetical protein